MYLKIALSLLLSIGRSHGCIPELKSIARIWSQQKRALQFNDLFNPVLLGRDNLWQGADGAYSLELKDGRTAWFFSDTLVGTRNNDESITLADNLPINEFGFTFFHNNIAIQERISSPLNFIFKERNGVLNQPFTPPDGRGWFWVGAAYETAIDNQVNIFLNQFTSSNRRGLEFGDQSGLWLSKVEINNDGYEVLSYQKLFDANVLPGQEIVFGASILEDQHHLYIYNSQFDIASETQQKKMSIARVLKGHEDEPSAWSFYDGQRWWRDIRRMRPTDHNVSNEFSVFRLNGQYIMITMDGINGNIYSKRAPNPWGPWTSVSRLIHTIDPESLPRGAYAYNAKAHPHLSRDGKLLIGYNVNVIDEDMGIDRILNSNIYRPRFVEIPIDELTTNPRRNF